MPSLGKPVTHLDQADAPSLESPSNAGSEAATAGEVARVVMAAFDRAPRSPEAHALVLRLVALIEEQEKAQGKRQRLRSKKQRADLVDAVGRFTGDLVASIDRGTGGLLACPKGAYRFTALPIGFRSFKAVYGGFRDLGLIEVVKRGGWQQLPEFGPRAGRGRVERIRAAETFMPLVRQQGVGEQTISQHFPRTTRPTPVELRARSTWVYGDKVRGRRLPVPENDTTMRLKAEVEELNGFIGGVRVEGEAIEFTGWTRIFNEGNLEGFAWDRGGRLYARPQGSYQGLSKEKRGKLTIDGEPVAEIDICSSHLALIYALQGISPGAHFRHYGANAPSAPVAQRAKGGLGLVDRVAQWAMAAVASAAVLAAPSGDASVPRARPEMN